MNGFVICREIDGGIDFYDSDGHFYTKLIYAKVYKTLDEADQDNFRYSAVREVTLTFVGWRLS